MVDMEESKGTQERLELRQSELDVKVILVGNHNTGKSSFVSLYAASVGQDVNI